MALARLADLGHTAENRPMVLPSQLAGHVDVDEATGHNPAWTLPKEAPALLFTLPPSASTATLPPNG
jgi:hypothetical protein